MNIKRTGLENLKFVKDNNIARIYYNWWGNAHRDNKFWVLLMPGSGDVEDYYDRETLVYQAKSKGWKYQVERHHKKERGMVTILENNYD